MECILSGIRSLAYSAYQGITKVANWAQSNHSFCARVRSVFDRVMGRSAPAAMNNQPNRASAWTAFCSPPCIEVRPVPQLSASQQLLALKDAEDRGKCPKGMYLVARQLMRFCKDPELLEALITFNGCGGKGIEGYAVGLGGLIDLINEFNEIINSKSADMAVQFRNRLVGFGKERLLNILENVVTNRLYVPVDENELYREGGRQTTKLWSVLNSLKGS